MYEEQFPAPSSPRPFSEIPSLWAKVTQMTEGFFAQEAPRASGSSTLIGVLILAVAGTILSTISSLIWGATQSALLPPEYREAAGVGLQSVPCLLCGGLISTFLGFYLGNGLVYLGARIFGGTGSFGTQAYLQSLFAVPIGIASGLVSLVPCVGALAALALAIYAVVLNVRAVKAVHNLTTGKAVAAILLPAIIIVVVVACLVSVMLVVLGPAIGNVFENIVSNIQ